MESSFRTLDVLLSTGQFNGSWIARNAYVDPEWRLLYVPTMKAACTAIKHFLRRLKTEEPIGFVPTAPEVSRAMFIHDNSQMPYRPLGSFSPSEVKEIVTAPGWFRFGVVRDPVDRFFSAWRDNVFLCRPGNERFLSAGDQRHVEFEHFLNLVLGEDDPLTCDAHWRAQWAILRPMEITYTHLYALNELDKLRTDIGRHLSAHGYEGEAPPIPRFNEGYDIGPEGFVEAATAKRLHGFYSADYEAFGFSKRLVPPSEKRTAADLTNSYTDAIFERHRVIAAHVYVSQLHQAAEREGPSRPA